MSLIQSTAIPSGSAAAFAIDDSCRFDNTNTTIPDSLHFTLGSPTNAKIFTLSFWAKITTNPTLTSGSNKNMILVGSQESGGYGESISMIRNSAGYNRANYRIEWYEESVGNRNTAPGQFRDHSAWYHFMFITDTTSGTAADRMQLWVNGVRSTFQGEPGGGTYTYSQNATPRSFNASSAVHRIGSGGVTNGQTGRGYQGYMAEMHFVDGTAQAVTDFGEFDDDSGIWKPKKVSGLTYGNNGWYLDFADSGDMGNDVSGNGNDFTLVGIDATNQSQDTPTNNFCTLNANDRRAGVSTVISKGALSYTSVAANYGDISMTMGVGAGKWYYEIKTVTVGANATHWIFGIRDADAGENQNGDAGWGYSSTGTGDKQWGFHSSGYVFNNTSAAAQPSGNQSDTQTGFNTGYNEVGNIFGIAIDMDNGKYFVGRNLGSTNTGNFRWYDDGSSNTNYGNPVTGAYPLANNLLTGTNGGATLLLPCFALYSGSGTGTAEFNFGSPPYTPTSGNADANGYGNFEHAVPSGFYALCSKNLAEFG